MSDRTPADPSDDWTVPDLLAAIESAMSDGEYDTSYLLVPAARLLREQAEQLDIQTALATNYAGKAVEYKQEKERAEEQLDSLRRQLADFTVDEPCNCGWGGVHDPDNPNCNRTQAVLAAAGGGVPEEEIEDEFDPYHTEPWLGEVPESELLGMWERADFEGGQTTVRDAEGNETHE